MGCYPGPVRIFKCSTHVIVYFSIWLPVRNNCDICSFVQFQVFQASTDIGRRFKCVYAPVITLSRYGLPDLERLFLAQNRPRSHAHILDVLVHKDYDISLLSSGTAPTRVPATLFQLFAVAFTQGRFGPGPGIFQARAEDCYREVYRIHRGEMPVA